MKKIYILFYLALLLSNIVICGDFLVKQNNELSEFKKKLSNRNPYILPSVGGFIFVSLIILIWHLYTVNNKNVQNQKSHLSSSDINTIEECIKVLRNRIDYNVIIEEEIKRTSLNKDVIKVEESVTSDLNRLDSQYELIKVEQSVTPAPNRLPLDSEYELIKYGSSNFANVLDGYLIDNNRMEDENKNKHLKELLSQISSLCNNKEEKKFLLKLLEEKVIQPLNNINFFKPDFILEKEILKIEEEKKNKNNNFLPIQNNELELEKKE